MTKTARIDDVKRPERVLPSATSRPILVTDHSTAPTGDPMLAPADDASPDTGAPNESPSGLTHTAKAIVPLAPGGTESAKAEPVSNASPVLQAAPKVVLPAGVAAPETPAKPESTPIAPVGDSQPAAEEATGVKPVRDLEAAQTAEEAAAAEVKAKRDAELEDVIAKGTYAVPVNALERRRSRTDTLLLCTLAILLLVLLVDVVADVGLIKLPASVPHTHLFSGV